MSDAENDRHRSLRCTNKWIVHESIYAPCDYDGRVDCILYLTERCVCTAGHFGDDCAGLAGRSVAQWLYHDGIAPSWLESAIDPVT